MWLVIGLILWVINILMCVNDVKAGRTTKGAAFGWFVVGWLTFDVIRQLSKLLMGV